MARFDLGTVLGDGVRLVTGNFPVYLGTQGLVLAVAAAIDLAASLGGLAAFGAIEELVDPTAVEADPFAVLGALLPLLALAIVVGLVGVVVSLVAAMLGIAVTDALLRGERPTLGEAFGLIGPRFWNYVGTSLLIVLAVSGVLLVAAIPGGALAAMGAAAEDEGLLALGLLLLVVLLAAGVVVVVWLALRWSLAPVASVLERHGPAGNLRRSGALTKGSKGMLLLLFVIIGLVAAVASAVLNIPFAVAGAASSLVDPSAGQPLWAIVGSAIVGLAVAVVVQPVSSAALVLVHRAVAAPPPPPAAPYIPEGAPPPYGPPPGQT